MEQQQSEPIIDTVRKSIRRSVTIKLISVFIMMMLLMIPMAFIRSLIEERQSLSESVTTEVSDKWANEQHIYGPILTIPYYEYAQVGDELRKYKFEAHILPSIININGILKPQTLRRGIYEVVVYDSEIFIGGNFKGIADYIAEIIEHEILWDEAFLTINISDLRGIKEKITINWNGSNMAVEPGSDIPLIKSGITVNDIFSQQSDTNSTEFSFSLNLQGSQYLGFVPLGKETYVQIISEWQDPSFSGSFLPDARTINDNGFTAEYTILELNRNFPQFLIGNKYAENIEQSGFGVNLLLPVNDYQKATRSAKYALLAISLTFLTFFLVEIFNKKEVHPFQYILIGLALCLFYTLLVSISEHSSFNLAYIISSVSVITMIGLYSKSILNNIRHSIALVTMLTLTYAFVFITLQIQDYALLIGSIGLTSIIALTMYITRNINWYELSSGDNSSKAILTTEN